MVGLEWQPSLEVPPQPAAGSFAPPIRRMFSLRARTPYPAVFAPALALAVTSGLDELKEFALCDRGFGDGKGLDFNRVRPLLVVENESVARQRSEQEGSPGNFDVSRQRTSLRRFILRRQEPRWRI